MQLHTKLCAKSISYLVLLIVYLYFAASLVNGQQFARPVHDILVEDWTPTPVYEQLNEVVPDDEETEVTSGNNPRGDAFEVGLSHLEDPAHYQDHVLRYRVKKTGPRTTSATISLYQGEILIATGTQEDITEEYTTYSLELSEVQASSMTDYTDLVVRLTADAPPPTGVTRVSVTWVELEIPDPEPSPEILSVNVVDQDGQSVADPSINFQTTTTDFDCVTSHGTLGEANQKIRITNDTSSAPWSLSLAATDGPAALWNSGDNVYSYNNNSGDPNGCDVGDNDWAGQLTVNPQAATIESPTNCSLGGLILGEATAFLESVNDSIVLLSADSSADTNCSWNMMNIELWQMIPPAQPAGWYTLDMTLTITAI